jgi:hypothetical protein
VVFLHLSALVKDVDAGLQLRRAIIIQATLKEVTEQAIAPTAARLC